MGSCHTSGATAALALVLFLLMAHGCCWCPGAAKKSSRTHLLEHTFNNLEGLRWVKKLG
jgi:hypothetical protein